jgi:hypothetical protein
MTALRSDLEHIVNTITQMSRQDVMQQIMRFDGRFKLDFTEDFLAELPLERLRHILLAARLQQRDGN